jgi:Zn-dependent peptidase ImmA (M78 family)
MAEFYKNRAWLYDRYVTKKKNVNQIADECGVSFQVIHYWLSKYQLIRNQRTWKK